MMTMLALLAQEVSYALKSHKQVLVTAESCTGGGLGFWLTSVAGSSTWYERGFITYSNQAKMELLGVSQATLQNEGAVSQPTACEMAAGALKNSHADISLAITGIAGPDGGSEEKPVGTVWIGWAGKTFPSGAVSEHFQGDRHTIRLLAIQRAMKLIKELVLNNASSI